ncbi:MAG: response regulator [Methylococcaceae bacterium]|nr:response regulator [Methylococcaceae bacterium]
MNKIIFKQLTLFFLILFSPLVYSVAPPLNFVNVKNIDFSEPRTIIQDHQGFIWIATDSGLYRYDGYDYYHFQHQSDIANSLPHDMVTDAVEDKQQRLWVATFNGLALFEPKSLSFKNYFPLESQNGTQQDQQIRKIASDGKDGLWLATRQGLQHFDINTKTFRIYRHDPTDPNSLARNNVDTLALDSQNGLWLATWPEGIDYLPAGSSKFEHHHINTTNNSALSQNVRALFIDSRNRLWLGTEAGVFRQQLSQPWEQKQALPAIDNTQNFRVHQFIEDSAGIIWAATSIGLLRWDNTQEKFSIHQDLDTIEKSALNNHIYALLIDHSESFWLGTNHGLSRADLSLSGFKQLSIDYLNGNNKQVNNELLTIMMNKENQLWLSSLSELFLINPESREIIKSFSWQFFQDKGIVDNRVYSLYQPNNHLVWIGTRSGLVRLNLEQEYPALIPLGDAASNFVNTIIPDVHGRLWLGTGGGLIEYDPSLGILRQFKHEPNNINSLSNNSVNTMMLDIKGNIWLSGNYLGGGLDVLNPKTGQIKHYQYEPSNLTSLPSNFITDIQQSLQGEIWLSSDSGISQVQIMPDDSLKFHTYRFPELESNNIRALRFDKNHILWIASASKLAQFDTVTQQLKIYPFAGNGYSADKVRSDFIIGNDGTLYFSRGKDMTIIQPELTHTNQIPPTIAITDIRLLNRSLGNNENPAIARLEGSITQPEKLTLAWEGMMLSLRFAALHYANPELNRYAYKLEGFNQDWIETDSRNRIATYTNLDPGDYVFRVKASNNNGVWNEQGISLPITITPPYWQTLWFRILMASALAALLLALYFGRIRQLRQIQHNLERQVNQRTIELTTAHQQTLAAAQVKSEFLANMSHEIRTPMHAITGMTHLILHTQVTEKQRNYLDKINTSAKWLLDILNDILDFSKIEAGKLRLEYTLFNLEELMQSLTDIAESLIGNKALSLNFKIDQNVPQLLIGDSLRLRQVLLNLVSNAIKFTETGSVIVHVEKVRKVHADANAVEIRFNIKDTGIGLSDEQQQQLFIAFNQADNSTTRNYGGTGLGLSISKELVEMMEGTIGIESQLGSGSHFYFTLSFTQPIVKSVKAPAVASMPSQALIDLASVSVLLVEDNVLNQELMFEVLQKQGIQVDFANNGAEAITILNNKDYSLVLMDCQMPIMDGFNATRIIRKNPRFSKLPIIAMTANNSPEGREQCLACGMNELMIKPINWDQLFQTLAQWIKRPSDNLPAKDWHTLTAQLPGFKLTQVMSLLGGDQQKLMAMLRRFHAQYASEVTDFITQINTHQLESAKAWLHSFKGSAGSLGAQELYQATLSLEDQLLTKQDASKALIHWQIVFDKTMTTLAALPADVVTIKMKTDNVKRNQIITELATLLNSDHFINDELLNQLKILLPETEQAEYNDFLQYIHGTDYSKALVALNKLSIDK